MCNKKITKYLALALMYLLLSVKVAAQSGPYDVVSSSGKYDFSYNETPGNLVPTYAGNTGTSYSWEMSTTPLAFLRRKER